VARRLFGTDGVRGVAGELVTAELALGLARAAVAHTALERPRVLIIRDPRESGEMLEAAVAAGASAAGGDVLLGGVLPTPAAPLLIRRYGFDLGVVISASHNPYADNGIKFFGADGDKLSDEREEEIEAHLSDPLPPGTTIGRVQPLHGTLEDYLRELHTRFADLDLTGRRILLDCANGATYRAAPEIFRRLGATVEAREIEPDGRNINDGCGSMAPDLLQLTVPGVRAHVGVALDGDGDRLVMVDHFGRTVDGDQLLYVIAKARLDAGELRGPVVGTVMTNIGLELALKRAGIAFHRAQVGDRYVLGMLREHGGILGGETSGHILCLDKTTTGDGLVSALQVLAVMKQTGRSLAELAAPMQKFPQVLLNVKVAKRFDPKGVPAVQKAVSSIEGRLAGEGRVVLRASGTEPVIRVMVEGRDEGLTKSLAGELADVVRAAAV
jgi:phosphoglucosamine mutase